MSSPRVSQMMVSVFGGEYTLSWNRELAAPKLEMTVSISRLIPKWKSIISTLIAFFGLERDQTAVVVGFLLFAAAEAETAPDAAEELAAASAASASASAAEGRPSLYPKATTEEPGLSSAFSSRLLMYAELMVFIAIQMPSSVFVKVLVWSFAEDFGRSWGAFSRRARLQSHHFWRPPLPLRCAFSRHGSAPHPRRGRSPCTVRSYVSRSRTWPDGAA